MTPAEVQNLGVEPDKMGKVISMQTLIPISLLIGIASAILFLGSALQRLDTAERTLPLVARESGKFLGLVGLLF